MIIRSSSFSDMGIPQGLPKGAVIQDPVYACQGKAWGKHCYRGPKQPVFIRKEHRYAFTVYALDCKLNLPETSCKQDVVEAMRGHILDKAVITGIYHSLQSLQKEGLQWAL